MKKLIFTSILTSFILFSFTSSTPECDPASLKTEAKEKLKPYKYDSAKLSKVTFKKEAQRMEVEVPLFIGESYRFVFNTKQLSKKIGISIYNKSFDSKKRELLYSNKDVSDTTSLFSFEPDKMARKMFVNYEIPEDAEAPGTEKGCVLFLLGYK